MSRDVRFSESWCVGKRKVAYVAVDYFRTVTIHVREGVLNSFCPMPGTDPFSLAADMVHEEYPTARCMLSRRIG